MAYIIGVSLGDGNLSCPNGRVTRLRITCDSQYPLLIQEITLKLKQLLPNNKVSLVDRKDNCVDISVYSNTLNDFMPWKVNNGSKYVQKARVPAWIFKNNGHIKNCLKGLLQTDGSVYTDRRYKMVNFTNHTQELAIDVHKMLVNIGYTPHFYEHSNTKQKTKYVVRVSKNTERLISELQLKKE